jgi:bacteriocin biosynthesis cyclodehydratase domain-containing protein
MIAAGLDAIVFNQDEVLIQYGSRSLPSELLRDSDLTGVLGVLFGTLNGGPASEADLLGSFSGERAAEASRLVADLQARGIITEADRDPVEQYLDYTFTGQASLSRARIALVGAGPLGLRLSESLVRNGVGQLTVLDDRRVDDIWIHAVGSESGQALLGQRANLALHDCLDQSFPARIEAPESELSIEALRQSVREADLTILAFEQPVLSVTHLVNRVCLELDRPWLHVAIDGNFGLVGPLVIPHQTACYNDFRTLYEASNPAAQMARRYRQHLLRRKASTFFPGLPVHVDVVAGLASLAAIHFLIQGHCFAAGRVAVVDFDRLTTDVENVLRLPRCPVCADQRPPYQPPFSAEVVTRHETLLKQAD